MAVVVEVAGSSPTNTIVGTLSEAFNPCWVKKERSYCNCNCTLKNEMQILDKMLKCILINVSFSLYLLHLDIK